MLSIVIVTSQIQKSTADIKKDYLTIS